ncbi:uncharacterized protein CTHT_0002290 [Thermochaetoides thermophila DSM 1495]|uniref:Uncharacterized protein n=1 Tax=Chaetomium thermophilum (strain DSM 1495 / CBS 144.50 / IMI 039719) TaxID=759272 RepID=G0RZA7_CHATD|nr:hypothetical protein CTHT_0002290 [Thermochaetoides thermophila DSM 1495]EGS23535.1 hypothetical protein CTHT_0002290 [Thermochaetoides thermophila DSM 1495]
MPAACQLVRPELAEVVLRVVLRGQLNDPSLNLAGAPSPPNNCLHASSYALVSVDIANPNTITLDTAPPYGDIGFLPQSVNCSLRWVYAIGQPETTYTFESLSARDDSDSDSDDDGDWCDDDPDPEPEPTTTRGRWWRTSTSTVSAVPTTRITVTTTSTAAPTSTSTPQPPPSQGNPTRLGPPNGGPLACEDISPFGSAGIWSVTWLPDPSTPETSSLRRFGLKIALTEAVVLRNGAIEELKWEAEEWFSTDTNLLSQCSSSGVCRWALRDNVVPLAVRQALVGRRCVVGNCEGAYL